jgi:hypothetical protein
MKLRWCVWCCHCQQYSKMACSNCADLRFYSVLWWRPTDVIPICGIDKGNNLLVGCEHWQWLQIVRMIWFIRSSFTTY